MKLINWNCQGSGNPLTVRALRVLVTQEKPNILFIMETKNQERQIRYLQQLLKFFDCLIEHPAGLAGGLALFWNSKVSIDLVHQSSNFFDLICTDLEVAVVMRLTYIHAPLGENGEASCRSLLYAVILRSPQ